jgi:hypothetical protein
MMLTSHTSAHPWRSTPSEAYTTTALPQLAPSESEYPGSSRHDEQLDAAINRALAAALLLGVRAGIDVMVGEGVPPLVAARVLLSPKNRRASDWKH